MVFQFLVLPFYPIWSLLVIVLDAAIIWALATDRGSRVAATVNFATADAMLSAVARAPQERDALFTDRPVDRPPAAVAVPAGPPNVVPDRLGVSPTRSEVASWAEELMTVLRAELDAAAHARVLSTAESELLLARLDLVVDQAMGPG